MRKEKAGALQQALHRYPYLIGLFSLAVVIGIVQVLAVLDCFSRCWNTRRMRSAASCPPAARFWPVCTASR